MGVTVFLLLWAMAWQLAHRRPGRLPYLPPGTSSVSRFSISREPDVGYRLERGLRRTYSLTPSRQRPNDIDEIIPICRMLKSVSTSTLSEGLLWRIVSPA